MLKWYQINELKNVANNPAISLILFLISNF